MRHKCIGSVTSDVILDQVNSQTVSLHLQSSNVLARHVDDVFFISASLIAVDVFLTHKNGPHQTMDFANEETDQRQ